MTNIKWGAIGLVIAVCIFMPVIVLDRETIKNKQKLHELEVRIDELTERTIAETMRSVVEDPYYYFLDIEQSDQWEVIEAVPYSRCYRHKVASSTADFIMCKAI